MSLTETMPSPTDTIAILRQHVADRERQIIKHIEAAKLTTETVASVRRHNHDLVVANNAYLERARKAEADADLAKNNIGILCETIERLNDRLESSMHQNSAQAALLEKVEEENGQLSTELDHMTRHKNALEANIMRKSSMVQDVEAFHHGCGTVDPSTPRLPEDAKRDLRIRLIEEEVKETITAMMDGDLVEVADGLADIVYVCIGAALSYGIPFDAVWAEVQRSNMAKFVDGKALRRADGKVIKPEGWTPPNIKHVLDLYGLNRYAEEAELVD